MRKFQETPEASAVVPPYWSAGRWSVQAQGKGGSHLWAECGRLQAGSQGLLSSWQTVGHGVPGVSEMGG